MKKFWTILCAVLSIFALTACGKSAETLDTTDMEATISSVLFQCTTTDEAQIEELSNIRPEELDLALIQYGLPCDSKAYLNVLRSWASAEEEMGELLDIGEFEFSESNGEINAVATAVYEDREADMTFTFEENGDLKALSVGAHYSTSEILTKAGLNTIIGMGIVFVVLIFIAVVIWLMGKVCNIKKKPAVTPVAAPAAKAEAAPVVVEETDDLELVAVITAAIAAASGTGSDGFVVRSIKRRSGNKWNNA